jgi:anti-sigma factor RsiW
MTCQEFEELMTAYLGDEPPSDKRGGFKQQIESCTRCQSEMATYENCTKIFRKFVEDEDPPTALRKAVFDKCGCKDMSKCCPPSKHDD